MSVTLSPTPPVPAGLCPGSQPVLAGLWWLQLAAMSWGSCVLWVIFCTLHPNLAREQRRNWGGGCGFLLVFYNVLCLLMRRRNSNELGGLRFDLQHTLYPKGQQ